MIKVVGFCQRNPKFTHEEYRQAHAGNHMSHARRLRNLRGYVLNTWNDDVPGGASPDWGEAPEGFREMWDGYAEVWFDSFDDYFTAGKKGTRDRAGEDGLVEDDSFIQGMADDGMLLYVGAAHQFASQEEVLVPVSRPEAEVTKVLHWGKRAEGVDEQEFRNAWIEHGKKFADVPGVVGYTLTFRGGRDVMSDFFDDFEAADAASGVGEERRAAFYDMWDGYAHIHFESPEAARAARIHLEAPNDALFERQWSEFVKENVALVPQRPTAS